MRFLVDGYNVTKRDPATAASSLAEQREALVARLVTRGADLLGNAPIVVVFDGAEGGSGGERRGAVEVRYARGESADEAIVAMAGPGDVVVTSDRGLGQRVTSGGATAVGAEMCFDARRPKRRAGRYPTSSIGLPRGANEITRELKGLWLDEEE